MRLTRWLGQLWLAPVTLVGLAVGLCCAGRVVQSDDLALYIGAPARGPLAWWFRRSGMAATTVGAVVLLREALLSADALLLEHEREHVRQGFRWGPLFPIAYALASLWARWRWGGWYADNHFERRARAAATRAVREVAGC